MFLADRWKKHAYLLRTGRHYSKATQEAANTYGLSAFSCAVLAVVWDNPRLGEETERIWIRRLQPVFNKQGRKVSA